MPLDRVARLIAGAHLWSAWIPGLFILRPRSVCRCSRFLSAADPELTGPIGQGTIESRWAAQDATPSDRGGRAAIERIPCRLTLLRQSVRARLQSLEQQECPRCMRCATRHCPAWHGSSVAHRSGSAPELPSTGLSGFQCHGLVGPKMPIVGVPSAAATCIRPESLEIATFGRGKRENPLRRSVPVRSRSLGRAARMIAGSGRRFGWAAETQTSHALRDQCTRELGECAPGQRFARADGARRKRHDAARRRPKPFARTRLTLGVRHAQFGQRPLRR